MATDEAISDMSARDIRDSGSKDTGTPSWKRFLPIGVIALGAVAALIFLRDFLTFETLEQNYQTLLEWRDANFLVSILSFAAVYIVFVAFSVPGAVWLTLIAGFLFGLVGGSVLVVISATIGATLVFLAAKTSLGALLKDKAGGWISRIEKQFQQGEISFLLIMRLVPVVPFFVANLAPAFLGTRLINFVWTTLIGIVPGTVVYNSIGAGLGEQLESGTKPDLGVIFEPHVIGPLLGLAALAALPLVLKKLGITKKR